MSYTNPGIAEIREWAYTTAPWPIEEWDLFLSWTGEIDLFIELATDHACPQKLFFLHMLYYTVGTEFGKSRREDAMSRIAWYADKGRSIRHGDIRTWVSTVDALLKGRLEYRYHDWRAGKLAGYNLT